MKRSASALLVPAALVLALGACATSGTPGPTPVTRTFANPAPIAVPGEPAATLGPAAPYPSPIVVTDMPASVTKVVVTLSAVSHTWPDDLDVLLVGPAGQHVLLMSDVGGSADLVNVTLVFDAAATDALPDSAQIVAGTYRPTNFGDSDPFAMPAPAGPYGTDLATFDGSNPNGTWNLYVVDDLASDVGSIGGGWSLTITSQ